MTRRFTIYSDDEAEPWPIVEVTLRRELLIEAIRGGTFKMDSLAKLLKNVSTTLQAAINEAKQSGDAPRSEGVTRKNGKAVQVPGSAGPKGRDQAASD